MTARPTEKLVVRGVVFVAEQRGPVEDDLKAALTSVFRHHVDIERAYLVRFKYGPAGGGDESVALCLAAPERMELAEAVAAVFRAHFAADVFMDILFVGGTREAELQKVARPFYVQATAAT